MLDDATGGSVSSIGQIQDSNNSSLALSGMKRGESGYSHRVLDLLTRFASHIKRFNIQVEMTASLSKYGKLVDEIPLPNVTAHFNSAFGDIASLLQCSEAYAKWMDQNLSKAVSSCGVIGVRSKSISRLLGYERPIDGFFDRNEPLNLQSAEKLLEENLQERKDIKKRFVIAIRELQSSEITLAEKESIGKNIMTLVDANRDYFQYLIDDKISLDSSDNQLINYASFFDVPMLIERLVEMGTNINSANLGGLTPLMIVARNGYIQSFRAILASSRIKLELEDIHGWTALTHASSTSYDGLPSFRGIVGCVGLVFLSHAVIKSTVAATIATKSAIESKLAIISVLGSIVLAVQLCDMGDESSVDVALPYNHCKHIFSCNHSRIKRSLINRGANKSKIYSPAITAINTVRNIFFF